MVRTGDLRWLRHTAPILLLAMLISTGMLVATNVRVHAASCYGNSCEGQNPYSTGCGSRYEKDNGSTYPKFIIHTPAGPTHAYPAFDTYLWWSDACNASWAEIYSSAWGAFNVYIQEFSTSTCTGFITSWRYAGSPPYNISYGTNIYSPMASEVRYWNRAYVVQSPLGPRVVKTYPCV